MKTRRYIQAAKATALSAVILSGLAGVGPAAATHLRCGSVITTDTTLTHDILGCTRTALFIGADNVTLNLGGFVLSGTDVGAVTAGVLTQNHSGVEVTNGIVKGFDYGVQVAGGSFNVIRRMTIKNNRTNIYLTGDTNTWVTSSKIIGGKAVGLLMLDSSNSSIVNNKLSNNAQHGIQQEFGDNNLIRGNTITYNVQDGIVSRGKIIARDNYVSHNGASGILQTNHGGLLDGMTLTGNLVCDNGRSGIRMFGEGHTITDNNVGAGTTGCLPNARVSGNDLFDEAAASSPIWTDPVCPSTWRNNYTQGDTFNHPCVTK